MGGEVSGVVIGKGGCWRGGGKGVGGSDKAYGVSPRFITDVDLFKVIHRES